MFYKNSKDALSDTIKMWKTISLFTNDIFNALKSKYGFNHILIEIIKREALRKLGLDEGIINFCPLCDYYECSQDCLLSEPEIFVSCSFGCMKDWSCKEFQESILEKDWDRARGSAKKFARELKRYNKCTQISSKTS